MMIKKVLFWIWRFGVVMILAALLAKNFPQFQKPSPIIIIGWIAFCFTGLWSVFLED